MTIAAAEVATGDGTINGRKRKMTSQNINQDINTVTEMGRFLCAKFQWSMYGEMYIAMPFTLFIVTKQRKEIELISRLKFGRSACREKKSKIFGLHIDCAHVQRKCNKCVHACCAVLCSALLTIASLFLGV